MGAAEGVGVVFHDAGGLLTAEATDAGAIVAFVVAAAGTAAGAAGGFEGAAAAGFFDGPPLADTAVLLAGTSLLSVRTGLWSSSAATRFDWAVRAGATTGATMDAASEASPSNPAASAAAAFAPCNWSHSLAADTLPASRSFWSSWSNCSICASTEAFAASFSLCSGSRRPLWLREASS